MKPYIQWVFLVAALAVPAFIFWNTAVRNSEDSQKTTVSSGANRPVRQAGLPGPASSLLGGRQAAGRPAPSLPTGRQGEGGPVTGRDISAAQGGSGAASAAVQISTRMAQSPPASSIISTVPVVVKIQRDPMLSPSQIQKLKELEIEKDIQSSKPKLIQKSHEAPIESRLSVMGIIQTPRGVTAIVNNEIVGVGSMILGAKVLQIADDQVLFTHKGRRFGVSIGGKSKKKKR